MKLLSLILVSLFLPHTNPSLLRNRRPRVFRIDPKLHKSKETLAREELERYLEEKASSTATTTIPVQEKPKRPVNSGRSINLERSPSSDTPAEHEKTAPNFPFKIGLGGHISKEAIEALLLRRKLAELRQHYSHYINITVNKTAVKHYQIMHSAAGVHGRGLNINSPGAISGRGIAADAPTESTTKSNSLEDGSANFLEGGEAIQEVQEDLEKQEESLEKKKPIIHQRVWGDECEPHVGPDEEDECFAYSHLTYGDDNTRLLACDPLDKICLCIMDDKGRRAEYSKELEICLVPEFYTCKADNQCAPLMKCAPATARDYERDPKIPTGNPNICRRVLHIPPNLSISLEENPAIIHTSIIFAYILSYHHIQNHLGTLSATALLPELR